MYNTIISLCTYVYMCMYIYIYNIEREMSCYYSVYHIVLYQPGIRNDPPLSPRAARAPGPRGRPPPHY